MNAERDRKWMRKKNEVLKKKKKSEYLNFVIYFLHFERTFFFTKRRLKALKLRVCFEVRNYLHVRVFGNL